MKPMAKLSLVRQRLYEKSCDEPATDLEDPEQPLDANRGRLGRRGVGMALSM